MGTGERHLGEQKQVEGAIRAARQAIALNPNLRAAYLAFAEALEAGGQLDEALNAYEKYLAGGEAEAGDFISAGNIAQQLNQRERAIKIFRDGEAAFPNSPDLALNQGWTLLNLNVATEALKALRRYERAVPAEVDRKAKAVLGVAVSRWLSKDKEGAVADFKLFLEDYPEYAEIRSIEEGNFYNVPKKAMLELLSETFKRNPALKPGVSSKPKSRK